MIDLTDMSEIEADSLKEIFNIGVGHAAAAMSDIVNEEVRMSVPSVRITTRSEAADELGAGLSLCGRYQPTIQRGVCHRSYSDVSGDRQL
ncbi:chemotaxis protein CheC [Kluyvera intermedia]|uniref:chemotaxis protein CheC n=1 Tax=Enterobacteriaceae TaxID=543 RepID=UPI000B0A5E5C